MTPFEQAAHAGNLPLLKQLLAAGADPSARIDEVSRWTVLQLATQTGRAACVEALLAAGANPDATNIDGETALHIAAGWGHPCCTLALLAAGANPNEETPHGVVPLTCSNGLWHDGRIDVFAMLIGAGANPVHFDLQELAPTLPPIVQFLLRNDPIELPRPYSSLPRILPYLRRDAAWWHRALKRPSIAKHRAAILKNPHLPPGLFSEE